MPDPARCPVCQGEIDPDSPATYRCRRCGTPHHYVCWVYNDRQCAVYGCEKTDVEKEERELLRESAGWFGNTPMRVVVATMAGLLALLFLLLAMETCRGRM